MKEKIKILKAFLFFFLVFFLIFNWDKISWIFNYKAIFSYFSNFFATKKQPKISPEKLESKRETEIFEFTEKENSIEIPSIQIFVPFSTTTKEEKELSKILDKGPVMFVDEALPGSLGRTIILGHSAMRDWPKSNPTWAFTYLRDVKEGDEIFINFEHKRYKYLVQKTYILKSGEELPLVEDKNVLFLITCWPPGRLSFQQKLVIQAELVK